ncbi:MAG: PKD domain-containing protein [Candidatus Paceibacterota bacterium]|jgi:hypothetical protein
MNKKSIIFSVIVGLGLALVLFVLPVLPEKVEAQTEGITGPVLGWLWSDNIGWIKLGDDKDNSMVEINNDIFSGYAWSSGVGWINFNPEEPYPTDERGGETSNEFAHGVKIIDEEFVRGWARACSVFENGCSGPLKPDTARGSWDGWIRMVSVIYHPDARMFSGYAWGGLNVGWIDFHYPTGEPTPPNPPGPPYVPPDGGGVTVSCKVTVDGSESNSSVSVEADTSVTYTATVNSDGGSADSYEWKDDEGGDVLQSGTEAIYTISYSDAGTHTINVRAFNGVTYLGSADCPTVTVTGDDEEEGDIKDCEIEFSNDKNKIRYTEGQPQLPGYSALNAEFTITKCSNLNGIKLEQNGLPRSGKIILVCKQGSDSWKVCSGNSANFSSGSQISLGVYVKYGNASERVRYY